MQYKPGLLEMKVAIFSFVSTKVIQISMDGPTINKKFYQDFIENLTLDLPTAPSLIDIGSSGLHTVHEAF